MSGHYGTCAFCGKEICADDARVSMGVWGEDKNPGPIRHNWCSFECLCAWQQERKECGVTTADCDATVTA